MSNQASGQKPKADTPLVFAARPSRLSWLRAVVPVVLLAIGCIIFYQYKTAAPPTTKPAQNENPIPKPVVELPKPAPSLATPPSAGRVGWIRTAALRNQGIPVEQFVALINQSKPESAKWDGVRALRVCEFEGDDEISDAEAMRLLQYAEKTSSSGERIRHLLLSGTGLSDPNWGALRPWRRFCLKIETPVAELLATPGLESNAALLNQLASMLAGGDRSIAVSFDGLIQEMTTQRLSDNDVSAAQEILVKASGSASASVRAAAARGFGEILALSPRTQFPETHPALHSLATLLNDADAAVAASAALALGNSAAAAGIQQLVKRLETDGEGPLLAAVLTALWHSESIGRSLDEEAMGAANWELRRQSFARLRVWLSSHLIQSDPARLNALNAAAALRVLESFAIPEAKAFSESLCNQLEKSQEEFALEVASEFRSRSNKEILQRSAKTKTLSDVAGPQWQHYNFSIAHAATLLTSKDRADNHAALWRLSRPGTIRVDAEFESEAVRQVFESAATIAKSSPYAVLRLWAIEALYYDHVSENDPDKSTWRLKTEADLALEVFMNDGDPAVQLAAADVLGRLGNITEIDKLTPTVDSRSAVAVDHILRGLVQRDGSDAASEPYTPPLNTLIDKLLKSADPTLAAAAGWAAMKDPAITLAKRIRLARSFQSPAQRLSALRALSELNDRRSLQPDMLKALLGDPAPEVRAAIFDSGLPDWIAAPAENDRLVLHGLCDPDESVQIAALKFRKHLRTELRPEVKSKIRELSESGSEKVRAIAAEILHK